MSTLAEIPLTVYERMIEAGVFEGDEAGRVELLRGQIAKMTPTNYEHATAVQVLTDWSYDFAPRDQLIIRVQSPVLLPRSNSVPQPDLLWIALKEYSRHPLAEDVKLPIEVADTTAASDLGTKAELYAEDGIEDYWVVNLPTRAIHVHRKPSGTSYTDVAVYHDDDEIRPLLHPQVVLTPSRVFGNC